MVRKSKKDETSTEESASQPVKKPRKSAKKSETSEEPKVKRTRSKKKVEEIPEPVKEPEVSNVYNFEDFEEELDKTLDRNIGVDSDNLFGEESEDEVVVPEPIKKPKTTKKVAPKKPKTEKKVKIKEPTPEPEEIFEITEGEETKEEIDEETEDGDYILHLPIQYDELIRINDNRSSLKKILTENVSKSTNKETIHRVTKSNKTVYTEDILYNKKMLSMTITSIRCIPHEIDLSQSELLKAAKTDVLCWWCCHQFDTYPVYLPVFYDKKRERYKVKGCFCSFNCCYSYAFNDRTVKDKSLVKMMYKTLTGKSEPIIRAPAKEILKSFGGSISIEEFRSHGVTAEYSIYRYPMVYIPQHNEEKKLKQLVKESITKIKDKETMVVPARPSVTRNLETKTETKAPSGGNSLRSIIGIRVGK